MSERTSLVGGSGEDPCCGRGAGGRSQPQRRVTYGAIEDAELKEKESPAAEQRRQQLEASKQHDDAVRERALKALKAATAFAFFFMICEIIGGYLAHSLAILTDAAHLLTDVAGFALAIYSLNVAARAACGHYSFGWHRAEVVGTLGSMFTIWALVGVIVYEALNRIYSMYMCSRADGSDIQHGQPAAAAGHGGFFGGVTLQRIPGVTLKSGLVCEGVQAPLMVIIGVLGLTVNLGCAAVLTWGGHHGHSHGPHGHGHSHGGDDHDDDHAHDHGHAHSHGDAADTSSHGHSHGNSSKKGAALNSAFLHALGDCVQSVGVILSAMFIWIGNYHRYGVATHATSPFNLADPLSSILFGVVTLFTTKGLIRELLGILMESTPAHIDAFVVEERLRGIEGVANVHDLHIWSLSAEKPSLSVHLVAKQHTAVLAKAQDICESFGISHHTIQVDDVDVGIERCCSDVH